MSEHIKDIIEQFIREKQSEVSIVNEVNEILKRNLDEKLYKRLEIKEIKDKQVIITSEFSSCCYEFDLRKKDILQEIKQRLPYIEGIKIKVK